MTGRFLVSALTLSLASGALHAQENKNQSPDSRPYFTVSPWLKGADSWAGQPASGR